MDEFRETETPRTLDTYSGVVDEWRLLPAGIPMQGRETSYTLDAETESNEGYSIPVRLYFTRTDLAQMRDVLLSMDLLP